jgi:hypothetical protein
MLHLYAPHHCAGAEMAAHALLRALVTRGHTVDVTLSRVHTGIAEPYTVDGVTVYPHRDKGDPFRWLADPRRRPDVIVTHLENTERASVLGGIYRVPVVHLLHNTFDATKWALGRQPALAVANTEWMARDIRDWWANARHGPLPPMIVVRPPVRRSDYRAKPGRLVTLVNVTADKGAATFYALADRFPATTFLAVEGAYGTQDRRERPNVRWQAHLPGDRMRDEVYRRTRILLMPSVYESYGRVGVEAACSGIPTIAHPTPGIRESLGDAATYADRADTDAWARHLTRLLTPAGWSVASTVAAARAAGLPTDADLDRWTTAMEEVAGDATTRDRR